MNKNEVQRYATDLLQRKDNWLDAYKLQKEFGISRSTQAKMRMNRTIPFHKVGKYIRYYRPDIEKMFFDAKVV